MEENGLLQLNYHKNANYFISDLLSLPEKDYLPPPPRGPQFPVEELLVLSDKSYVPPPPRESDTLTIPDIINSHIGDSGAATGKEHYIPPKTLNDVPKNFIRPEDLPEPPAPEDFLDIEVFFFYGTTNMYDFCCRTMARTVLMMLKFHWMTWRF